MLARIITMHAKPGQMQEAVNLARNVVVPSMVSYPGFHHWYSLVDWEKEKILSVALWENEESMQQYGQHILPRILYELGKFVQVRNGIVESFDIAIDTAQLRVM